MQEWLHQSALLLLAGSWTIAAGTLTPSGATPAAPATPGMAVSKDLAEARKHWAYQPIRRPAIPSVREQDRVQSPVDAFVAAKLEAQGLTMSPPADRRTLIRRVYFDLVGLPPSWEDTEAFVTDRSPDAFAKIVDRLLASPQYGECWGRHWLDVARYAETKDLVLLFGKDRLQPYAYTYRDYVVRALNLDTPFNQFVEEQIAADQIQPNVEPWRLAALGFLTVGRLFDNNINDQIDDQIDTVSRGFLGLTVACARCHNHKYDAIPTADYYSLYGVFASCERPYDLPLIEDPAKVPGGLDFENKLAEARQKLQEHIDGQYELLSRSARERVADYLVRVATTQPDISETATFFLSLSPEDLRPGLVSKWRRYLEQRGETNDPVFAIWNQLMSLADGQLGPRLNELVKQPMNPLVAEAFQTASVTNKAHVARVYGTLLRRVYDRWTKPKAAEDDQPSAPERELLAVMIGEESPLTFAKHDTPQYMSRTEKDKYGTLVAQLDKLAAYASNRPPARAMVLRDLPELYDPHVFIRGRPSRLGEAVPRRFLRILAGDHRVPFPHGSGRLDLARAIVAPDNPLTSRVIVNRIWMHHFGEPLVSSPNDFGTRSDPPMDPELLDYLAWTLQHEGWSLKKLHRLLVLSSTYQQASLDRPACRKVDPENRLLWRANRHRLDFEGMRDSMLTVSGRLDPVMGGRSVDVANDPTNGRRTIYGLVDRQDLPAVFRAFDFACPDQSVEKRARTIVPQQALFTMNSAFVMEQARALASRARAVAHERQCGEEPANGPAPTREEADDSVIALYQLTLGRPPEPDEVDRALEFIRSATKASAEDHANQYAGLEQFAQVLLMSNEFMFVD
jgi:hypothetical protein